MKIPGTNFMVLDKDNAITTRCLESGRLDWDHSFLEIPEIQNLKAGDVVWDVGAYIGDTTKIFLDKGCEVFAFECYPDALKCLRHNCPTAMIFDQPVGDGTQGYLMFPQEGGNLGARFLVPNWSGPKTMTLDSVPLIKCDFLKIDVEGYEPFVLDGALALIKKFSPIIHIEINQYALMRYGFQQFDVTDRLKSLGYQLREVSRYDHNQWDAICKRG